jgi:ClpX C4-type zinc finger protein
VNEPAPDRCSFCGRSRDDVAELVAGAGGVAICERCVALSVEFLEESLGPDWRGIAGPPSRGEGGPEVSSTCRCSSRPSVKINRR